MHYKNKHFWLFVEHRDHTFSTPLKDRSLENEWLKLEPNGSLTIKGSHQVSPEKGGYAWGVVPSGRFGTS